MSTELMDEEFDPNVVGEAWHELPEGERFIEGSIEEPPEEPKESGLDEELEASVDYEDVRQIESDALLPAGTYETLPSLTRTFSVTPKGRGVHRFFGGIVQKKRNKDTGEVTDGARGSIGITLSRVRVNKVKNGVQTGEPDLPSKLYGMAARAYEQATGARAQNVAEIMEFLEEIPVKLRVIQIGTKADAEGEPGNIVVSISAIKE